MKKRAEITVETQEVIVIRWRPSPLPAQCPRCGARLDLLPPEQAALVETNTRGCHLVAEDGSPGQLLLPPETECKESDGGGGGS